MDQWSDPWADNQPDSPTKLKVATPARTTTILNNVWDDDAQWGGNEDSGMDDMGGWAGEVQAVGTTGVSVETTLGWGGGDDDDDDDEMDTKINDEHERIPAKEMEEPSHEVNEWDMVHEDALGREAGKVVSETSDSATTIQPDEAPRPTTPNFADSLHPDDDLSTRPSISSSDLSQHGTTTESPRTSFDEPQPVTNGGVDGQLEDHASQESIEPKVDTEMLQSSQEAPIVESGTKHQESTGLSIVQSKPSSYPIDADLMKQLFDTEVEGAQLEEAPDDPAFSSSATRKAWYRLTRKSTMREFNSGQDYDNYIRVTWKSSTIRSEVNKTVLRWANEDRMAGRGPGARASFYWDTPAPPEQKMPLHTRQRSAVAVSNPIKPSKQDVLPLSTDVPAAFSWSSPIANDPWKDNTVDTRSSSYPAAPPKHIAVTKLQRQGGRGGSLDLSPSPREPASHKRTATSTDFPKETSIIPPLLPAPQSTPSPPNDAPNPWAGLGALDTSAPPKQEASAQDDDDDEWGEMVESPAVSTADSPFETGDATLSTPASTPQPVKTSPLHAHLIQTGSKHASPIVRLKGTVSPTSSTFKRNAFVPASIEQGPIGPGLLKSRSTSAHSPPRQSTTPPPPVAQLDEVLNVSPPKPPTPKEPPPQQDDFSAFDTSTPEPTTSPPTPSPPSNPEKNTAPITTTSWGEDADFSIFESSIPQTSMPPTIPPSTSTPDPTDPWSIFNTPPPSRGTPTAEDSLSGSFARPSSREQSPPTLQPPMTATNSAQRRKDEEDELIRGIVAGLPDLGYMLRR